MYSSEYVDYSHNPSKIQINMQAFFISQFKKNKRFIIYLQPLNFLHLIGKQPTFSQQVVQSVLQQTLHRPQSLSLHMHPQHSASQHLKVVQSTSHLAHVQHPSSQHPLQHSKLQQSVTLQHLQAPHEPPQQAPSQQEHVQQDTGLQHPQQSPQAQV